MTAAVLTRLTLPWRLLRPRRGQHTAPRGWHPADERVADTDVRSTYGVRRDEPETIPAYVREWSSRLAPGPAMPLGVPRAAVYPRTPAAQLTPLPAFKPRAVPDVPDVCHCGRPAGHLEHACRTGPLDDIAGAFDTQQFTAVTL